MSVLQSQVFAQNSVAAVIPLVGWFMFSLAIYWCAALFWNQVILKQYSQEQTNYV